MKYGCIHLTETILFKGLKNVNGISYNFVIVTIFVKNFDKSSLLFGKRINTTIRQMIKDVLGIQNEGGMRTYLGIPEDISGSKCKHFAFLKDKFMHQVNEWTCR